MWPLRHFARNDSLRIEADFYETVRNMLSDFTIKPSGSNFAYVQAPAPDGRGWTAFVPMGTTGSSFRKPFDVSFSADNFRIQSSHTLDVTWHRGKRVTEITAGAGLTYDEDETSGNGWIATDALTTSQYVWLEIDNSDAGATEIIMGADPQETPSDSRYDYIEVFPLWYIPVADGAINQAGVYDLRSGNRISGMA